MTSDRETTLLGDELHDLADDIGPVSPDAARDRARRGIARHTRNRRAALASGAGVVVMAVAVTLLVTVDRDTNDSRRPIGPAGTSTRTAPTVTSPTTAPPGQPTPGSPVLASIPPMGDLPAMASSYAKTFPWGTGPGQVAYSAPGGEGVSGGPLAFSADAAGSIVMLDHSSGRLVRLQNGAPSVAPIAVSPAVTAAVFDPEGRVIVATVNDVAVYLPGGVRQSDFGQMGSAPITRLQVVGKLVFSVSDTNQRLALLADDGKAYEPIRIETGGPAPGRVTDPDEVEVDVPNRHAVTMSVLGSATQYQVASADANRNLQAVRMLPDGTLAFVLLLEPGVGVDPAPSTYVVGRIDPQGHARYQTVSATSGYLVNGPGFVINDDGLAVLASTAGGGATVTYYPFT